MEEQRPPAQESPSKDERTPEADRKLWESPRLRFVKPKLARHGKLEEVTRMPNGFFGQFSP